MSLIYACMTLQQCAPLVGMLTWRLLLLFYPLASHRSLHVDLGGRGSGRYGTRNRRGALRAWPSCVQRTAAMNTRDAGEGGGSRERTESEQAQAAIDSACKRVTHAQGHKTPPKACPRPDSNARPAIYPGASSAVACRPATPACQSSLPLTQDSDDGTLRPGVC